MAAKMFAEVVIAGSYKNLAKSTRGATKELTMFEKTAKKISGAVSAAFAGIAIAGITMLTDALIDMAKAAAKDRKSMALLNATLEKNWKATDQTIAGVSEYIDKTSMLVGIVDDDLRPAFAKIARVTKDQTKAQKAFDRVLDISAGTGKDVNLVAQAYSKFLGGNKTALDKLIPGLKDAGNKIGFMDEKYQGMAAVAGKNDPFNLINISLGEFQEKIGTAFLPLIDKLAEWLTSDAATSAMNDFADGVQEMFGYFSSDEGQKGMQQFLDGVTGIADAIAGAMKEFDKAKPLIDFLMWTTSVANAPLRFLGEVAGNIATAASGGPGGSTPVVPSGQGPVYITVNAPSVNAQDVIKSLQAGARSKGVSLQSLLR
jgi:hypothetical protein